jgi:hypothetical protein
MHRVVDDDASVDDERRARAFRNARRSRIGISACAVTVFVAGLVASLVRGEYFWALTAVLGTFWFGRHLVHDIRQ